MKVDRTYKHIYCKDVAFKPTSIYKDVDTYEVYGFWINVVATPYTICTDTITIKNEDVEKWKEYTIDSFGRV